jgi:hypothetical protein
VRRGQLADRLLLVSKQITEGCERELTLRLCRPCRQDTEAAPLGKRNSRAPEACLADPGAADERQRRSRLARVVEERVEP